MLLDRSACQWDSHHPTVPKLGHKQVQPSRSFSKSSSGCLSCFSRLTRGYSFLQTLLCELCHLNYIRDLRLCPITPKPSAGRVRGSINTCYMMNLSWWLVQITRAPFLKYHSEQVLRLENDKIKNYQKLQ